MPRLVVVEPPMEGVPEAFELREKELSIGRAADSTICLDREAVSTRHVLLKWKDGDYEFIDLDSTNGTYYNGEKVQEGTLRNGDVFQVADVVFNYESTVDPNDMEKLVKAEESARQEKAWQIRKNMEARKTGPVPKLDESEGKAEVALPMPPESVGTLAKENSGLSLATGVILFIIAFALGCLGFYTMLIMM